MKLSWLNPTTWTTGQREAAVAVITTVASFIALLVKECNVIEASGTPAKS